MREYLPNRRGSEMFEMNVNGLPYRVTYSGFADGRLGELCINNHKSGSTADTAARGGQHRGRDTRNPPEPTLRDDMGELLVDYVLAQNLRRRELNPGQRSAIEVSARQHLAEAKETKLREVLL